ncbi:MAG: hypothetical protein ACJ79S_13530 [Gemmatimonadaceae bacterium]
MLPAVRTAVPALAAVLLAGCYVYVPPSSPEPAPGTPVALELNDQGRLGLAPTLGPALDRIGGTLVSRTDSAYTLRVSDVTTIRGERSTWTGERYQVPVAYVGRLRERRLSRSRTMLVGGAVLAAVGTFVLTRTVNGGGEGGDGGPSTNPPSANSSRVPAP